MTGVLVWGREWGWDLLANYVAAESRDDFGSGARVGYNERHRRIPFTIFFVNFILISIGYCNGLSAPSRFVFVGAVSTESLYVTLLGKLSCAHSSFSYHVYLRNQLGLAERTRLPFLHDPFIWLRRPTATLRPAVLCIAIASCGGGQGRAMCVYVHVLRSIPDPVLCILYHGSPALIVLTNTACRGCAGHGLKPFDGPSLLRKWEDAVAELGEVVGPSPAANVGRDIVMRRAAVEEIKCKCLLSLIEWPWGRCLGER